MDSNENKVYENYLRRQASRVGLSLEKIEIKAMEHQQSMRLQDYKSLHQWCVLCGSNFVYDLEEIAEFLEEHEVELKN